MICHVCQHQAVGQCKSCGKFYCAEHGDVYCVRCAGAVRPAGQPLDRDVQFGVQETPGAAPLPGAPRCHACDTAADRACCKCGRFFCPTHGSVTGIGLGGPSMPLCRECAEQAERRQMWGCLIGLGIIIVWFLIFAAIVSNQ